MSFHAENFDFVFCFFGLFFGRVIVQEKVIAHAGEGQSEGFSESMCAAGDESERFGHMDDCNGKRLSVDLQKQIV